MLVYTLVSVLALGHTISAYDCSRITTWEEWVNNPECTPPKEKVSHTLPPRCRSQPADIQFLLDASGSVGDADYKKGLDFVKKFVNSFNIGPGDVRVGLTNYESVVDNKFFMKEYLSKAQLLQAIENVQYGSGGGTATGEAMKFARENAFTSANGGRGGATDILIVMTDGESGDPNVVASEAQLAKQANIKTYAIGIGSGISHSSLQTIASDSSHVFTVTDAGALEGIVNALQLSTCNDF